MKNTICILFLCFSISNYAQYNNLTTSTLEKEADANYLKNILLVKDDLILNQTLISPNLISGLLIKNASLNKATVYNVLGQIQKKFVFLTNTEDHVINLSQLPKGIYYIVLEEDNKIAKQKIIIN